MTMGRNAKSSGASVPLQFNNVSKEDITKAQKCISAIIADEEALQRAAQAYEFESLANELQSAEVEITQQDIELARHFEGKKGWFKRWLKLFN